MNDLRAAAQQALEALTCTGEGDDPGHRCGYCDDYVDRNGPVRAALRAALADQPQTTHWQGCEEVHPECAARARVVEYPVQEPVAWTVVGDGTFGEFKLGKNFETSDPPNFKYWKNRGYELAPLYTAPPQRRPVVDPAEYDDAGAAERYNRGLK